MMCLRHAQCGHPVTVMTWEGTPGHQDPRGLLWKWVFFFLTVTPCLANHFPEHLLSSLKGMGLRDDVGLGGLAGRSWGQAVLLSFSLSLTLPSTPKCVQSQGVSDFGPASPPPTMIVSRALTAHTWCGASTIFWRNKSVIPGKKCTSLSLVLD